MFKSSYTSIIDIEEYHIRIIIWYVLKVWTFHMYFHIIYKYMNNIFKTDIYVCFINSVRFKNMIMIQRKFKFHCIRCFSDH